MIKEYSFPSIFQNVLGDIIPKHILERIGQPFLDLQTVLSEEGTNSYGSSSEDQPMGENFWVKSKKKHLQRRSKFNKTMNFFTYRPKQDKENFAATNSSLKFASFLKKGKRQFDERRKQSEKNSGPESQSLEIPFNQSEELFSMPQNNVLGTNLKRNIKRFRTSLEEEPIIEDNILQEGLEEDQTNKVETRRQRAYLSSRIKSHQSQAINETDEVQSQEKNILRTDTRKFTTRKATRKQTERTQINPLELERKSNRSYKGRSFSKKKTVLFASGGSPESRYQFQKRKTNSKKGTQFTKQSHQNSSNKAKPGRMAHLIKKKENESNGSSYWTGKSLHSMKFDQKGSIRLKSKKSIDDHDSLLDSQRSFMRVKDRKKTRTVKFIPSKFAEQKPYKSQEEISDDSDEDMARSRRLKRKNSNKSNMSRKTLKSQTSIQNSKKKVGFNAKKGPKVSLLKTESNVLLDSSGLFPSQRDASSFRDMIYKKNREKRLLKSTIIRKSMENHNVYNELNNFINFFNEDAGIDSESQIQRNFTKPIIIPEETLYRDNKCIRQSLDNENLCIDMGLRLVRKMNKLVQKKL